MKQFMKQFTFVTDDGDELSISHSSSATKIKYRIYIKGDEFPETNDGLGNKIPKCIHLTHLQAQVLISALSDLMEDVTD